MTSKRENLYENFIRKKRDYIYPEKTRLYRHRILPGFRGGQYTPSNCVYLSLEDHAQAHRLRWKCVGEVQDLIAYLFLTGKTKSAIRVRHWFLKKNQRSAFYNPEIQRKNRQKATKKRKKEGFYGTTKQQVRGKKGALVNKLQGTGGFDPKNLKKARQVQRVKQLNFYDPAFQRRLSLQRWGFEGLFPSPRGELRTSLSETFIEYYCLYSIQKKRKHKTLMT